MIDTSAMGNGSAARRLALRLHLLDTRDRGWLLQRLAPTERDRLLPLLSDLARRGVPRDPALHELTAPQNLASPFKRQPTEREPVAALDRETLRTALDDEPLQVRQRCEALLFGPDFAAETDPAKPNPPANETASSLIATLREHCLERVRRQQSSAREILV